MVTTISGYPFRRVPVNNVTPFTYRDGTTYLQILSGMQDFINNVLIENVNEGTAELVKSLNGAIDTLSTEIRNDVESLKTGINTDYESIKSDLNSIGGELNSRYAGFAESINTLVDTINNRVGPVEIQQITLTDQPYVIEASPLWPSNQPVNFEIKQNASGNGELSFGAGISGSNKFSLTPIPGAITRFTLTPKSGGGWDIVGESAVNDPGFNRTRLGKNALANSADGWSRNNNAVGSGALYHMREGFYNDFFGLQAGYYLDGKGESGDSRIATRNSGFGSNTQRFNKTGFNNVSMGRNSLQNNVTGKSNTYIGAGSGAGFAPIGLDNQTIENQIPLSVNQNTAVGESTLRDAFGDNNTAIGYMAGYTIKKSDRNTAVGRQALGSLDINTAYNGKIQTNVDWDVHFNFDSGEIVITHPSHGLGIGYSVGIKFPHLTDRQHLYVKSADRDRFTLERNGHTLDRSLNGQAKISYYADITDARINSMNTALGSSALAALEGDTAWGGCQYNTALGFNAGSVNIDGTPTTVVANSTMLGANSKVSGINQLQLGNETQNVYSSQAIQVRSDIRDKADVEETKLGLDFINMLRPVDYKYDFRSDYFEYDEEGSVVKIGERDGSKKRSRVHHGLIAQDIEKLIQETGIDFGGFQDHKKNGGSDVLTVAYEELIAPLIKAVQELSAKVAELQGK